MRTQFDINWTFYPLSICSASHKPFWYSLKRAYTSKLYQLALTPTIRTGKCASDKHTPYSSILLNYSCCFKKTNRTTIERIWACDLIIHLIDYYLNGTRFCYSHSSLYNNYSRIQFLETLFYISVHLISIIWITSIWDE